MKESGFKTLCICLERRGKWMGSWRSQQGAGAFPRSLLGTGQAGGGWEGIGSHWLEQNTQTCLPQPFPLGTAISSQRLS